MKGQSANRPKARNAPTAQVSPTDLQEQVAALTRELKEARQQQSVTADVLKVISRSTFDLQTVLDALTKSAARLCAADIANIWLVEGSASRLAASYQTIKSRQKEYLIDLPLAPSRGSCVGRTLLEAKTVHIHDIRDDPEYELEIGRLEGYRTMLGVPLLREGAPIGVLALIRSVRQPFTPEQIELVNTFAAQAVIAIENTRLLNELRQRTDDLAESLEQQTATAEILQTINRSPGDVAPVFDAMVESAMHFCQADYGHVYSYDGEFFHLIAAHGEPRYLDWIKQTGPRLPENSLTLERVISGAPFVHIADIAEDDTYRSGNPRARTIVDKFDIHTLLTVALRKEDKLLGSFVLYRRVARPFSEKQVALVQNFATQAVIAMENARLLTELRQRTNDLSESLQQQTATADVLKVISSSPGDLEPVFEAILGNAVRICGAKFGNLFLCEADGLRAVAFHDAPQAYVEERRRNPVLHPTPATVLGRALATRQSVQVPDLQTYEPDSIDAGPGTTGVKLAQLAGARTVLAVPMVKESELVGALTIYRQEVLPFTDKQVELVQNFAAQAVIAVENTRLLSELRESLQQQTATADVLKVISRSTFELQPVFDLMAESAVRLCEAERAYIFRFNGQVLRAVASFNAGPENQDWVYRNPIPLGRHSVSARAGLERRTVQVADIQADPEYSYVARDVDPIRTTLAVPMLRGDELIGTITIYRLEVKPFTENQIALMETFADQAVIAIENARLFESLQARTRELANSLEELRTAQDRLVQTQKLASLGQLTAGIAHEIKNPLNFVNNFSAVSVELIDELRQALAGAHLDSKLRAEISEIGDTLQGNLDKVVQHGKRADAIVKNMLLHSRESSGEHRPVDINALVAEGLNLAYHGARAEKQGFNVTLERSFDPTAGAADVFPQDITRALLNLISNGFYAAAKRRAETNGGDYEPTLIAVTKNLGDRVEIRIRDNGTGIPPEVKEKIFNPFFTTKPAGEGTGLGLSISHDIIVKQHGGSIEVDTQPGQFTEIRIVLPRMAALLPERS